LDWYHIGELNHDLKWLLCIIMLNALDVEGNYVKAVEGRTIVSATKMWPNESSFWQYMTDANSRL